MKRVRYQHGSLVLRARAKTERMWELRFYEADMTGKRQRHAITVGSVSEFPSEAAARKSPIAQAALLKINSEGPHNGGTPISFGAVLARYEQEEMPTRHSTSASYKSVIKNFIRPRWAEVQLTGVKPLAVEEWLKVLPLAPKTKGNIRSLMHTIFDCAERWELVARNPINLVRVKGASKRQVVPRTLTPEEFCQLPPLLPEPYRTQVWIAGCLGLRPSEIMPLQWADFDFDRRTLLITRSIVHGKEDVTKTEYSHDYVPLDDALIDLLLEHKKRAHPTSVGWVFANPETDKPYHQDTVQQNHIRVAGKLAGLGDGLGWKAFRHSYRAWMDKTQAPVSVQKELMRHASIQTTMNIYGKAMTDDKRKAHSKVVQMLIRPTRPEAKEATEVALTATGS